MSCSIFRFGSGFVIQSAGLKLVPTFFATNLPDLDASCIHRFCMSTCFAWPNPQRLTKHIVAEASKCRLSPHDVPKSFATLWIPSPSDAVLTAAYSPLSAEDSDTTCRFLVSYLEAVSASHDDSGRHRSSSGFVASPVSVWVRFQLATLLPAEPALCSRLLNEASNDPLDTLHVTH